MLTALKLDLAALRRRCGKEGNSECVAALDGGITELGARIDSAIDCVRRVSSELRPTVLDRLGLAAALEWQAREIESCMELTVLADIKGLGEQRPWLVAVTLFRIAQEALTNVVRHAQAKTVWLEISGDADNIELVVRDDGRGMAAGDNTASLGVLGMRERANLVGGTFSLELNSGKGTTVRIPASIEGGRACASCWLMTTRLCVRACGRSLRRSFPSATSARPPPAPKRSRASRATSGRAR